MKKILIICIYIGKLPNDFKIWLESCKKNNTIDWLLVTDQQIEEKILTSNIKVLTSNLEEIKAKLEKILNFSIKLNFSYKLCDFRPVYGELYKEYTKNYDFWGHCDMDMIFGDIRKFFTDDILEKNEKILKNGHLSLYLNNDEMNNLYKVETKESLSYKTVFNTDISCGFDENNKGINEKAKFYKKKIYEEKIFIDIDPKILNFREISSKNKKNYFTYEDGKIYRNFQKENKIEKEECLYIHFQKRKIDDRAFNIGKYKKYYLNKVIEKYEENKKEEYLNRTSDEKLLKNTFLKYKFYKKTFKNAIKYKILYWKEKW